MLLPVNSSLTCKLFLFSRLDPRNLKLHILQLLNFTRQKAALKLATYFAMFSFFLKKIEPVFVPWLPYWFREGYSTILPLLVVFLSFLWVHCVTWGLWWSPQKRPKLVCSSKQCLKTILYFSPACQIRHASWSRLQIRHLGSRVEKGGKEGGFSDEKLVHLQASGQVGRGNSHLLPGWWNGNHKANERGWFPEWI